jgi:hypothetical protein
MCNFGIFAIALFPSLYKNLLVEKAKKTIKKGHVDIDD